MLDAPVELFFLQIILKVKHINELLLYKILAQIFPRQISVSVD
jgi:hypothetical protein